MLNIRKINIYIVKEFLKLFIIIYFSLFLLVFLVDFLEFSYKISKFSIPLLTSFKMILYRCPKMIEDFMQFIILISTAITIKKFSLKSELTIFYSNGVSLWQIMKILFVISFFIGATIIFLLNPIASRLAKISRKRELFYTHKENIDFIEIKSGIWFNQDNLQNKTKMITKSKKIYLDDFIFKDNIVFVFDENGIFLERLNVDEMKLYDGFFVAKKIQKFKKNSEVENIDETTINTNLKYDFIKQRIRNRYENVNQMSIFKLISLTTEFKKINLNTNKFVIKQIMFLVLPIIFMIMNMIACIIIQNNNRNNNNLVEMFTVIVIGVIFYILQNVIFELSMAEKINYIISIFSWLLITILICIHKLISKIELVNC